MVIREIPPRRRGAWKFTVCSDPQEFNVLKKGIGCKVVKDRTHGSMTCRTLLAISLVGVRVLKE